jgi:hypothetical protein
LKEDSMRKIDCVLEIEDEGIVTVRGRRGEVLMKMRCPLDSFGTFTRIRSGEDADNYWIGVKPADSAVFGTEGGVPLFDPRAGIAVTNFEFAMVGGRRNS